MIQSKPKKNLLPKFPTKQSINKNDDDIPKSSELKQNKINKELIPKHARN